VAEEEPKQKAAVSWDEGKGNHNYELLTEICESVTEIKGCPSVSWPNYQNSMFRARLCKPSR
jgi:hypothetical protein